MGRGRGGPNNQGKRKNSGPAHSPGVHKKPKLNFPQERQAVRLGEDNANPLATSYIENEMAHPSFGNDPRSLKLPVIIPGITSSDTRFHEVKNLIASDRNVKN